MRQDPRQGEISIHKGLAQRGSGQDRLDFRKKNGHCPVSFLNCLFCLYRFYL